MEVSFEKSIYKLGCEYVTYLLMKEVWMELSGANKLRRDEPDLYTTMLAAEADPVVLGGFSHLLHLRNMLQSMVVHQQLYDCTYMICCI